MSSGKRGKGKVRDLDCRKRERVEMVGQVGRVGLVGRVGRVSATF